jgi:hypothetical protein
MPVSELLVIKCGVHRNVIRFLILAPRRMRNGCGSASNLAPFDVKYIRMLRRRSASRPQADLQSCSNLRSAYVAKQVSLPLRAITGAPELVAKSP